MDATEPGRVLAGRYRLTAVIGSGGMGVVWHGYDELLGRDVAVKEITSPPDLTEQERQVACRRAIREAQMAGRLNHRNVVRIYDIVEEDDGHPYIVMEFLPYKSLRDLLREKGPLPPDRAAHIGLGVLAALSAAHAEGILHRDVKPANILVGPDGRVVLTDFGIARAVGSPTLTTDGALLGSPSYIAPEHARNGRSGAGAPGDLWGLGASLYTAVEGHPPFGRGSALATLTAVIADEPDQALHAGPLEPVISGLLRKDPEQRLTAAGAERLLRRVAGPHPRPVAAPAASPPADPEPRPSAPPRPRRPGRSRGLLLTLTVLFTAAAAATGLAFALTISPVRDAAAPGGNQRAAASHGAPSSASPARTPAKASPPEPSPTRSAPLDSAPPASPSAGGPGGSAADGALPAGYHRFTSATGFSVGVPDGWQVSRKGHYVYVTDPSDSNIFLLIDQSGHPESGPFADWEQQANRDREGSYPGYRLISLRPVSYPQAEKAADLEFTYVRNGVRLRVLNRNILANGDRAYALYWSAPESDWSADYHYFQVFAATFKPAPAQPASGSKSADGSKQGHGSKQDDGNTSDNDSKSGKRGKPDNSGMSDNSGKPDNAGKQGPTAPSEPRLAVRGSSSPPGGG